MRPPVKRIDYEIGDKVEVCSSEEGFRGSYYEATIISRLENGKYVVRYKNLLEDDESGPLIETLFPKDFRPSPPHVRSPRKFQLRQKVDVFYNDGWWLGKIVSDKVLTQKGHYYKVYVNNMREAIYYSRKRIRVHHELIHGDWILEA
ncbi:unnamed protein product [Lathyrus sativus]|nr:unnamed protein product [Lathyrus sativus]